MMNNTRTVNYIVWAIFLLSLSAIGGAIYLAHCGATPSVVVVTALVSMAASGIGNLGGLLANTSSIKSSQGVSASTQIDATREGTEPK